MNLYINSKYTSKHIEWWMNQSKTWCKIRGSNNCLYTFLDVSVSLSLSQVSDLIIPTAETSRQLFFLRTYLSHEVPILIVGPTGTGKSVINNNFLMSLPKERYTPICINFSARTSANQTQDIIMSKLDRRRKGVFGPPMGKKCIIYVGKK